MWIILDTYAKIYSKTVSIEDTICTLKYFLYFNFKLKKKNWAAHLMYEPIKQFETEVNSHTWLAPPAEIWVQSTT